MTQERQTPTTASRAASRFARAGFDRPVEHLHFDRRARVWRSHDAGDTRPRAGRPLALARDGVLE